MISTKKEYFVVRKNVEISEGKQVNGGGGGKLASLQEARAIGQHNVATPTKTVRKQGLSIDYLAARV